MSERIISKPSTPEYEEAYDRVFSGTDRKFSGAYMSSMYVRELTYEELSGDTSRCSWVLKRQRRMDNGNGRGAYGED